MADVLLLAHWHLQETKVPWAEPVPASGAAVLAMMPPETLTPQGHLQLVQEASGELAKIRALIGGE